MGLPGPVSPSEHGPQQGPRRRLGDDQATERKQAWALFWDTSGGELSIHPRQSDGDPEDAYDLEFALEVIDGDVPLEGWVSLAQAFLHRLER